VTVAARPLFILAPARSFTSVICGMLGQHPALYGLPEVNLFAADTYGGLVATVYNARPGFRHGLLRAVAQLGLGEQSVANVDAASSWLEENRNITTTEIFSDLAAWAAPRRLVDKSPLYTYSAESLARIETGCPDALYLHLTRHPRATCESVYRLRIEIRERLGRRIPALRGSAKPLMDERIAELEDPESLWLKPHEHIMNFLEGIAPERQRRIRGEVFMTDPDRHLGPICEWLGVSSDRQAIAAMKHPETSPYARFGPVNALFGNDPSFLESPELRPYTARELSLEGPLEHGEGAVLNGAIAQRARQLGYE